MTETAVAHMQRADIKRAKDILDKIDEACKKANESKELLQEAADLANTDTYQGVRAYDQRDIRDIESVLRVAVMRPLNHLCARWIEIHTGRQQPYTYS